MKSAPNQLTPEQDAEFDSHIKRWQSTLGLADWRVERSSTRRRTRAMADVGMHYPDRLAVYRTGDFGQSPTRYDLESTALHELLHILLYELVNARSLGIDGELLTSAEHRVINALEKALMDRSA